ncbi:flavoprotein subunit-like protein [Trypanosoma grayi]|uniref:flavoprotein subunit-like protein n=1 Tax=Trypanosoma grayi TaxID=71804 RepID=UPI0004F4381F|nr:flavoprotein subunit-like protein [Trypanosoma grayi]KEG08008.1 flavoprotein subunit-like protein [Trypanosoma grayi]
MASSVTGGNRVIVIGGGLAGVCAAHSVLEHGGSVLLVDKSAFLGGNSTKASSGITGTPTQAQVEAGVLDGVSQFIRDTNKSFHGGNENGPVSPLVEELSRLSGPSIDWLSNRFKVDLSQLGLLGGHSGPRVHRGKERFPGMAITCALIDELERLQKENPCLVQIVTKTKVVRLIREPVEAGPVSGVVLENRKGEQRVERGVVIIASGGYAADFGSEHSLLARFKPELLKFATTNAEHATGDGIKMAERVGAQLVDMELVQVHPTGLVDTKDPNSPVKFLCAEALRGTGALIINAKGRRFVNELGRRDEVSSAMLQNEAPPFRLLLSEACAKEMPWHCKHYTGRGLMKHYKSGTELAKEMNIAPHVLQQEFNTYRAAAKTYQKEQRRRRRWSGMSSPRRTDSAKTNIPGAFGKTIFRNADSFHINAPLYAACITPVVHYTMGGLAVNTKAEVLDSQTKQPIAGLYCAGEAAGGVHGKNRLGGNSLLDCVVFGRVAGTEAARYLLSTFLGPTSGRRLDTIYSHLTLDQLPPLRSVPKAAAQPPNIAVATGATPAATSTAAAGANSAISAASTPSSGTQKVAGGNGSRKYTIAAVAQHNKPDDCWCIIGGQVLDLTTFLSEHPGGRQSILMYAGKDATEVFDLVHKRELIDKYTPEAVIGEVSN